MENSKIILGIKIATLHIQAAPIVKQIVGIMHAIPLADATAVKTETTKYPHGVFQLNGSLKHTIKFYPFDEYSSALFLGWAAWEIFIARPCFVIILSLTYITRNVKKYDSSPIS